MHQTLGVQLFSARYHDNKLFVWACFGNNENMSNGKQLNNKATVAPLMEISNRYSSNRDMSNVSMTHKNGHHGKKELLGNFG